MNAAIIVFMMTVCITAIAHYLYTHIIHLLIAPTSFVIVYSFCHIHPFFVQLFNY